MCSRNGSGLALFWFWGQMKSRKKKKKKKRFRASVKALCKHISILVPSSCEPAVLNGGFFCMCTIELFNQKPYLIVTCVNG